MRTDDETARWMREMVVAESSARITAEHLSVAIAKSSKNETGDIVFCGECCFADHNILSSSSEVDSDDDVWIGALAKDMTSPTTSPPVIDASQQAEGSRPKSLPTTQVLPVILNVRDDLEILRLADSKVNEAAPSSESHAHPHSELVDSIALKSEQPPLSEIVVSKQGPANAVQTMPTVKSRAAIVAPTEIRNQLIREVTATFRSWPFVDIRNRLPNLKDECWNSPTSFLDAIKSDVLFMECLRSTDTGQYDHFVAAGVQDLVPILHLFLLNGVDIIDAKNAKNDWIFRLNKKRFMPLERVLCGTWGNRPGFADAIKLLLGFGARLDFSRFGMWSHRISRLCCRDMELLNAILELHPEAVDHKKRDGHTLLVMATRDGSHEAVEIMIKRGADFGNRFFDNSLSNSGIGDYTSATYAEACGYIRVLEVIVAYGLDLDERETGVQAYWLPLHYAVWSGRIGVVKYLLSQGANPTSRANYKDTPLKIAKRHGHTDIVAILEHAIRECKEKR